jgi:hypothetical protein
MDDIPQEEFEEIKVALFSLLTKEEIEEIENDVLENCKDEDCYSFESFELFDLEDNSLNITSLEGLESYYEGVIQDFKGIINNSENLISEDEILISSLQEKEYYYSNKELDIINDSGKILKIVKIEIDEENDLDIDGEYCAQKTSFNAEDGIFEYDRFYLNPRENETSLFYFEYVEDVEQIKELLQKEFMFDGLCISEIPENEPQDFGGYMTYRLFNDSGKDIKIVAVPNLTGSDEEVWILEAGEVADIWSSDIYKGYWTFK